MENRLRKNHPISNTMLYAKYILEESSMPHDEICWLIETALNSDQRDTMLEAIQSVREAI
jgi:hypothetical protein